MPQCQVRGISVSVEFKLGQASLDKAENAKDHKKARELG